MAKDNNLQDLLTDIADAIREKKGTTEKINAQNFSAEIASIETGGGVIAASTNDVNFRDYDGTILHSYTKDEFLALSALPNLPTREGLICQEWNWSFEDAQEYVAEYGRLEVGATYITDDGKTRLYIRIAEIGRMDVPLMLQQSVSNGVVVDWGDGNTETFSGTSATTLRHTYSKVGDYVITLEVLDGTLTLKGSSSYGIFVDSKKVYGNMLQKVEIGNGVTSIGTQAFFYCYSLASIVIPNSVTSIRSDAFVSCYSLTFIVIPNSVTIKESNAFVSCSILTSIVIPNSVTSIGSSAFQNCYSLTSIVIPNSVTSIGGSAFQNCHCLTSIVIPNSVTSIGSSAFKNCLSVVSYDFRTHTSVPTLSSTGAFSSIPSDCKIVVPDALYDEWISATNWSTYASQIFKASDVFPSDEPEDEGVIEYHFEIPMEEMEEWGMTYYSGTLNGDFASLKENITKLVKSIIPNGDDYGDYIQYYLETEDTTNHTDITVNGYRVSYIVVLGEPYDNSVTLGFDETIPALGADAQAYLSDTSIQVDLPTAYKP